MDTKDYVELARKFQSYDGKGAHLYVAQLRAWPPDSTWSRRHIFARRHDDEKTARDYVNYIFPGCRIERFREACAFQHGAAPWQQGV